MFGFGSLCGLAGSALLCGSASVPPPYLGYGPAAYAPYAGLAAGYAAQPGFVSQPVAGCVNVTPYGGYAPYGNYGMCATIW